MISLAFRSQDSDSPTIRVSVFEAWPAAGSGVIENKLRKAFLSIFSERLLRKVQGQERWRWRCPENPLPIFRSRAKTLFWAYLSYGARTEICSEKMLWSANLYFRFLFTVIPLLRLLALDAGVGSHQFAWEAQDCRFRGSGFQAQGMGFRIQGLPLWI